MNLKNFQVLSEKGKNIEGQTASIQKNIRFQKRKSSEPTVEELFDGVLREIEACLPVRSP